jgi:alpha-1,2-mannosyltransferase
MASVSFHCEALPPLTVRKDRLRIRLVPGVRLATAVTAAAAGLRLLMLWRQGGVFSDIEYDDGVHLGSSLLLAHGHALYRNQVFLHPPGISLLLLPFSWASAWFGQPSVFAVTRLVTVVVSGAVAGLATYVVGRGSSWRRALLGGGFAVVFGPSIVAGSTLMLEPWLGLFGLLAVERLTVSVPRRTDVVLAGGYLGVATTIKAWGVIPLAGVAIWLLFERRRDEVSRLLTAAAATVAVVFGPFLAIGGSRPLDDVVWTQLARPPDGVQGLMARTATLLGLNGHLSAGGHGLVGVLLVGLAILIWRAAFTPGVARLSAIVLALAIPVFGNVPSFFFHYGDFFTPWAALLIATQPALRWPRQAVYVDVAAATAAILVISLLQQSVGLMRRQRPADMNVAQLQRLVGQHQCVVSDQVSLLLLAGAFDRPGCPSWLDPRGAALTELRGSEASTFYPSGFQRLPHWQHEYLELMSHAELLILTGDPCGHQEWTSATCHWVQIDFLRIAKVGHAGPGRIPVEVWQRRQRLPTALGAAGPG